MKLFKCVVSILLVVCAFVIVSAIAKSIPDDIYFGNKPKAWVDPILTVNRYIILIAAMCIIMVNQMNLKQKFDVITMMIIAALLCVNIGGFILESVGVVMLSFLCAVLILVIRQLMSWQMSIKTCIIVTIGVILLSLGLLTALAFLDSEYMLTGNQIYMDISIGAILSMNMLIAFKLHRWFLGRKV